MSPMKAEHLLFNSGWLSDDFPNEFTPPPSAWLLTSSRASSTVAQWPAPLTHGSHVTHLNPRLFFFFSNIPGVELWGGV